MDYRLLPRLRAKCEEPIGALCTNIPPGDAAVISCLLTHEQRGKLGKECGFEVRGAARTAAGVEDVRRPWRTTPPDAARLGPPGPAGRRACAPCLRTHGGSATGASRKLAVGCPESRLVPPQG